MVRGGRVNNKSTKKRPFEEAREIEIQAEPQIIMPMVDEVARKLCSHNFGYEARRATTLESEGTFVWYNVLVIEAGKVGVMAKRPIGAFTLQSLGNNRTLLTVLPHSRWGNGDLTPMERGILAYSGSEYDKCFRQFIKGLDDRLRHDGLIVTWHKKIWQWIKSHKIWSIIIVGIPFLAGLVYLIDYLLKFLGFSN